MKAMKLLAGGAMLASAALACTTSGAESEAGQEPDSDRLVEEVVVTGSRIRRDPLTARDSVLDLDMDDRTRSGLTSLGDLLARLPISGSPLSTRFNSSGNFGFPAMAVASPLACLRSTFDTSVRNGCLCSSMVCGGSTARPRAASPGPPT